MSGKVLTIVGWIASILLMLLFIFCACVFLTHSGITAFRLSGALLVYGGLATILAAAATTNPIVNGRLRFLKTGLRQFMLGLTLTILLGFFSLTAWGAWGSAEEYLAKDDFEAAIPKLRYAAALGPEAATYDLALAYWKAKPPIQNKTEAFIWMKRAAEADASKTAPLHLGLFYQQGIGTPIDLDAAARWYQKAAEAGNAVAAAALGDLLAARDPATAARWYRQAVDGGYTDAAFGLGLMFAQGSGVSRDTVSAAHYYKIAADAGNRSAQLNYGSLLYNGDGVSKDKTAAIGYFEKASQSDDADMRQMAEKNLAIARH